jgi:alginate O-acetyltransferase complex protein AlgJ
MSTDTVKIQPEGREEEAKRVLESTRISTSAAWLLSGLFLLTIFTVPIVQWRLESTRLARERAEALKRGEEDPGARLQVLEALDVLPSGEQLRAVKNPTDAWNLVPRAGIMDGFERALEDNSVIVSWVLPRFQSVLAGAGGVGNEQAYIGRQVLGADGKARRWLHYRPDVDLATSRGFLDPALLRVRQRGGDSSSEAVQPDPLRAIVAFKDDLKKRGIQLIVAPTPVKAQVHPETLSNRYSFGQSVLQNPSFEVWKQAVERAGVPVFDASDVLLREARRTKRAQYLETDTHWTPPAMQAVARELAAFIAARKLLPNAQPEEYTTRETALSNTGDIAGMLKLPENSNLFAPQTVRIRQVLEPDGEIWYPRKNADVLLLGDSFCNIYSLAGMGWGEGAGFGEQLSFEMKRAVDSITNNAGGSHVTRERLVNELKAGKPRLRNKKLVVWQFAARDLLIGNWKVLRLPEEK